MQVQGLSSNEVRVRTEAGLVNNYRQKPAMRVPVIIFKNLFIIFNILLFPLLAVLLVMGQYKDVASVGTVALINTLLNIYQEIRAKRALDKIRVENPALAMVLRDGTVQSVPTDSIVQGDYLVMRAGELALADGPLVESQHLEMDESMLTGESDYVAKDKGENLLSGSYAVAGQGIYVAEKIGKEAYMQQIVSQSKRAVSKTTLLEKRINILVNCFMALCFIAAGALFLKYMPHITKLVTPVRYIVASVTSMIPQGLVLIVTLTFALGVIAFAKRGIIFRRMNAVESLSNVTLICMDKTGTLTHNRSVVEKAIPLDGKKQSDFEALLGDFAALVSDKNKTIEAMATAFPGKGSTVVDEIPFTSRNKYSALRIKRQHDKVDLLVGAAEMVSLLLRTEDKGQVASAVTQYEEQGLRTVVVAVRKANDQKLRDSLQGFLLAGLVVFREEIKKEAPAILRKFAQKGVKQVVISGDSLVTVRSIAHQIGLSGSSAGIDGPALSQLDKNAFRDAVLENTIFARISPEQKRNIIKVFRKAGYYTAMVGDGVNDVLALKESNLSFAMGSGGSMAKDVADIVLVNNRFDILPDLLAEGDRIVSRVQDCARIFTLKNFYALLMIFSSIAFGFTFPFLPQQITLINFLTITIPLLYLVKFSSYKAKVEKDFLKDILRFSLGLGLLVAGAALGLNYLYSNVLHGAQTYVRTVALFPVVVLALSGFTWLLNRAQRIRDLLRDKRFLIILLLLGGVFVAAIYSSIGQKFFEVVALRGKDWLRAMLFTLPVLFVQFFMLRRYIRRTK